MSTITTNIIILQFINARKMRRCAKVGKLEKQKPLFSESEMICLKCYKKFTDISLKLINDFSDNMRNQTEHIIVFLCTTNIRGTNVIRAILGKMKDHMA